MEDWKGDRIDKIDFGFGTSELKILDWRQAKLIKLAKPAEQETRSCALIYFSGFTEVICRRFNKLTNQRISESTTDHRLMATNC